MSYRWQETIKILIPGFYILICAGVEYFTLYFPNNDLCELIEKLSGIIIILMFFLAFVIGYINEILSGIIEYVLYMLGIPRPSRLVLNNAIERFSIAKNDELRQNLQISANEKIDNKCAAKSLAAAKQATEMEKYQEYYYQSILARNLFFGHLFSFILFIAINDWSWFTMAIGLVVTILFGWQWWKMNLTYVKNVFVKYLLHVVNISTTNNNTSNE